MDAVADILVDAMRVERVVLAGAGSVALGCTTGVFIRVEERVGAGPEEVLAALGGMSRLEEGSSACLVWSASHLLVTARPDIFETFSFHDFNHEWYG